MSDPMAKAERSKHKDARQSLAPDSKKRLKNKRKVRKPYVVEYRGKPDDFYAYEWGKWNAYVSLELAEKNKKDGERKMPFWEFRIIVKQT